MSAYHTTHICSSCKQPRDIYRDYRRPPKPTNDNATCIACIREYKRVLYKKRREEPEVKHKHNVRSASKRLLKNGKIDKERYCVKCFRWDYELEEGNQLVIHHPEPYRKDVFVMECITCHRDEPVERKPRQDRPDIWREVMANMQARAAAL